MLKEWITQQSLLKAKQRGLLSVVSDVHCDGARARASRTRAADWRALPLVTTGPARPVSVGRAHWCLRLYVPLAA